MCYLPMVIFRFIRVHVNSSYIEFETDINYYEKYTLHTFKKRGIYNGSN